METVTWHKTSVINAIQKSVQVNLFLIDFNLYANIEAHWEILNHDEQKRAARFHFEKDKKRFVITRATLKNLIGFFEGIDPKKIYFDYNQYGKPAYSAGFFQFNVAHSGTLGLIGISAVGAIGVDVEEFRPQTEIETIAKRFFSPVEFAEFCTLIGNDRLQGFFNAWTRKEAFIKAVGMGLSMPLHAFDVNLTPGCPAKLKQVRYKNMISAEWQLQNLPVRQNYAASFCVGTAQPFEFICHFLQPEQD